MELVKSEGMDVALLAGSNVTGFEDVDASCVSRPYLAIAQNTSKMAAVGSQNYIEGLKPGMFYSPTTRQVFGDAIDVCIIKFSHQYAIYTGKDQMGMYTGFKGYISHNNLQGFIQNQDRDLYNPQTKEIAVDKRNFIIMFPSDIEAGMFLYSMSSASIPVSRRLITQAMSIRIQRDNKIVQAPIWSSIWRLKTGLVQSKRGMYYQVASIERIGWTPKQVAPVIRGAFEELANIDQTTYYEEDVVTDAPEYIKEEPQPQKVVESVFKQAPKPDVDDVPLF